VRKWILLSCVAAFAAGLLAGTLIWPEGQVPPRRAPTGPRPSPQDFTAQGRATRRADAREDGAPETRAEERSRNADVRELAAEAGEEIERLVTSERAEAILAGEGVVSGTVRDPAGAPVAGVMVTALPEARPFGLAIADRWARQRPHEDRDLTDVARDAIEGELWRRYARRTVKTGPDGRFELGGLMDAGHTVTAFHERYDVQPLSQKGKVVPDAVVDFLARPVIEVRVEVRMPDGSLAEHAWLRWEGPQGSGGDAWTQERGKARLPVGSCRVKAQTWVPEPLESAEVERVLGPKTADETLVLQLEGRRVLTARLVLPEGFVLPRSVEYRLRRLVAREEVDPASLLQDESQRHAKSPSPGRAYWFALAPGRSLVAAFLDKRRLVAHAVAQVGTGPTDVELPVDAPTAGDYVTVKLLGPDGGPIPGQVSFRILTGPENRPRHQRADALQRGDGAWLVLLDGFDTKDGNDATLRVGTRDYGGAMHPVDLRSGGTITIRFDQPARLQLQLDRYSGSGVEGSLYAALLGKVGADAWRLVSPDGSADLGGVQPGAYRLQLIVRRQNRTWSIHQRRLNLDTGDDELSLAVPPLHVLRVRWAGPGRPGVALRCNDEAIGTFRRDARLSDRVATFDALAAGTYEIECAGRRATVRVPGAPEVTLE
jgi:hypothetical protein